MNKEKYVENNNRKRGFEKINTEKNNDKVLIPQRSTDHSAAYDLHSAVEVIIPAKRKGKARTGIKAYMLEDEVLMIHPRSSQGIKLNLRLQNTTGVVDSDYYNNPDNEGEIYIFLENRSDKDIEIKVGDRISQAMFQKFLKADNDEPRGKRIGGFGSTGR